MDAGRAVSSVLKRRVVKPTEQRRREILEAAMRLFAERGFHETAVDDVATAAGVAKGTIYLYFRSKEHLLIALKQRFMTGLVERLTEVIAEAVERLAAGEGLDHRDIIDEIFQALVDYHLERREEVEVVVRQSLGPDLMEEALELEQDLVTLLSSAFNEAGAYGIIETADPEMSARLVHAAIRDNLAACLCYGEPADLDRLVGAAKQFLYKALAPDVNLPPRRPRLVHPRPED